MKAVLPPLLLCLAACSAVRDAPSLAPRAGETIDPRLPVEDRGGGVPADPQLTVRLQQLVVGARAAAGRFEVAIARAEQLAAGAGARGSDGWVTAQQALSAAVAERYPVTRALADIDAMAAARVQGAGPLSQADQAQVREAAADVAAIDTRQAARVDAVQRRLGS